MLPACRMGLSQLAACAPCGMPGGQCSINCQAATQGLACTLDRSAHMPTRRMTTPLQSTRTWMHAASGTKTSSWRTHAAMTTRSSSHTLALRRTRMTTWRTGRTASQRLSWSAPTSAAQHATRWGQRGAAHPGARSTCCALEPPLLCAVRHAPYCSYCKYLPVPFLASGAHLSSTAHPASEQPVEAPHFLAASCSGHCSSALWKMTRSTASAKAGALPEAHHRSARTNTATHT